MNIACANDGLDEKRVLAVAVMRVATLWKLSHNQLGGILGLTPASAARLRSRSFVLRPSTLACERGRHLLRLFRSLDTLADGDDSASMAWLQTPNLDLNGRPIDLIRSSRGLNEVIDYIRKNSRQVRSVVPRNARRKYLAGRLATSDS